VRSSELNEVCSQVPKQAVGDTQGSSQVPSSALRILLAQRLKQHAIGLCPQTAPCQMLQIPKESANYVLVVGRLVSVQLANAVRRLQCPGDLSNVIFFHGLRRLPASPITARRHVCHCRTTSLPMNALTLLSARSSNFVVARRLLTARGGHRGRCSTTIPGRGLPGSVSKAPAYPSREWAWLAPFMWLARGLHACRPENWHSQLRCNSSLPALVRRGMAWPTAFDPIPLSASLLSAPTKLKQH